MFPPALKRTALVAALVLCGLPATATHKTPSSLEFHVTIAPNVADGSVTGRVLVMLSRRAGPEPRNGPSWSNPEPFYGVDVKDHAPDKPVIIGANAIAFPGPLANLEKGNYTAQAVLDFDRGWRQFSTAPGNGYGSTIRLDLDPAASGVVSLRIDQVVKERPFQETDRVKLVDVESKLLTAFHGRPTRMRAGVVLPKSFAAEPTRHYPVVYEIPGFGGSHTMALSANAPKRTDVAGVEMLYVVLDPNCRLGHHVFADSANNGPCGRALVEELIPHLEKQFRALGVPEGRFVTGHSSGGWSSLWLQVAYPDFFGGVWSTAPDPVDFRDFQRIDLYQPGVNMFTDREGRPRPLMRRGGKVLVYYQRFSDMEEVMGHGGQLASFEAVFSPRGGDGKPLKLWDRRSSVVDPTVAREWQKYDIRLILETNWKAFESKLKGKLHVYTGGEDTFYLEGATKLLEESLGRLGSDAVVEIVPGKDHGTLLDRGLRERIAREMAGKYREHFPANR